MPSGKYPPPDDSIPARALQFLQTMRPKQWITTRALADAIGVTSTKSLHARLKARVDTGEIQVRRTKRKEGVPHNSCEWRAGVKREYDVPARREALKQGRKTYETGLPCARGHIAPRAVSNRFCVECQRTRYDRRKHGQTQRVEKLAKLKVGQVPSVFDLAKFL